MLLVTLSRPPSVSPTHSPGSVKDTPTWLANTPTHPSPGHMVVADLNGQLSHLRSLLETERKRKEACQKEIARLSKELRTKDKGTKDRHPSGNIKTRGRSLGTGLKL